MPDNIMSIQEILAASEREASFYNWKGTFADYLAMVVENPSIAKLAHARIRDSILAKEFDTSPIGEPIYRLFEDDIFGLDDAVQRIVEYFKTAAEGSETSKRILLLLGPPASGKSTIVALIKRALEDYTRTDEGAVYAIAGCPMQEEPLHLIPHSLRPVLKRQYGIEIEGELNPRNRYLLKTKYSGKIADMPVERVVFSEHEAVGIGYYVATNPNGDSSLLVGSIDTDRLEGDRREVAGQAFRMDGEFNVANRGMIEFVEMFKADKHLLTTLLGLAQEQIIKMEKFGSIYAEEVIIGHSNEGDFNTFALDEHSEALKDRIIAIQVPYNLRVSEEVKIYDKVMERGALADICISPLSLRVASTFAVLSRLEKPVRQTMTLLEKMRLYDGRMVKSYTRQDLIEMKRHHPGEGMSGISPRYVMNRIATVASIPDIECVTPLAVLDSLWRGMSENISLDDEDRATFISLVTDTVNEYNELAISEVQRAYPDSFDDTAAILLDGYLKSVRAYNSGEEPDSEGDTSFDERDTQEIERPINSRERDMQEIERPINIRDKDKRAFRQEIDRLASLLEKRNRRFEYTTEPRLRAAIESRLFSSTRELQRALGRPRFARQRAEWEQRRVSIVKRLIERYDYCAVCAEDLLEYVTQMLQNKTMFRTPKNEGVEWQWELYPTSTSLAPSSDKA
jgi:serine protein kinase